MDKKDREYRNFYMRSYNEANKTVWKEIQRRTRYKMKYGITVEQYEQLLILQNGHCALCNTTPDQERYKKLNVDHDHKTGLVRGLLCISCNSALAKFGDNLEGILRVVDYLSR